LPISDCGLTIELTIDDCRLALAIGNRIGNSQSEMESAIRQLAFAIGNRQSEFGN
jgi:hypothetical protein